MVRREEPGHGVVQVVVSGQVPDVGHFRAWLVHAQKHVDGHLLVCVYGNTNKQNLLLEIQHSNTMLQYALEAECLKHLQELQFKINNLITREHW